MLVLVGTHFVPSGTYFCIFIEHKIEWIFKINELKIEKNLTLPSNRCVVFVFLSICVHWTVQMSVVMMSKRLMQWSSTSIHFTQARACIGPI